VDTKKTPKKRKRVYRVEFDFLDYGPELDDCLYSLVALRGEIKNVGDENTIVKNLKIRRVKA